MDISRVSTISSNIKYNELEQLIVETNKDPIKNYLFEVLSNPPNLYKDCSIRKSCLEMLNNISS